MINITDKYRCCGCGACVQKCPKRSIKLIEDKEGFLYPYVNIDTCIDCGLCERICPTINIGNERTPQKTFCMYSNDEQIRMLSSSGGIFSIFAERVLKEGGVVFGARYDTKWQVVIDYIETFEELAAFRGSKYVQSNINDAYVKSEKFLKGGRKVLFSGTPCQIAGLRNYLCKNYDNLLTIDVACHGVPSPLVWSYYLNNLLSQINHLHGDEAYNFIKKLHFTILYDKLKETIELRSYRHENDYTLSFIHSEILRPSCYKCNFKNFKSGSDLTIADFWGIQNIMPELNDPKGLSLVIANSEVGLRSIENIDCSVQETDAKLSIKANPALYMSTPEPYCRNQIFDNLNQHSIVDNLRNSLECDVFSKRNFLKRYAKYLIKRMIAALKNNRTTVGAFEEISSGKRYNEVLNEKYVEISNVNFRDKSISWQKYGLSITLKLKKII